jgi:hypothetical protein
LRPDANREQRLSLAHETTGPRGRSQSDPLQSSETIFPRKTGPQKNRPQKRAHKNGMLEEYRTFEFSAAGFFRTAKLPELPASFRMA